MTGVPGTYLIVVAAVIVLALVLLWLVNLRARSRARGPQAASGPSSPTAIVCSFCKREYDPAETGGRCPGCGAAAPRRG